MALPEAAQDSFEAQPERPPPEDGVGDPPAPGAAAVPRCAFCGGGPSGLPSEEVLRLAQAAARKRKASPRLRLALGAERGFLGPLLGPLSEKFGLAGVWVHRECAIWSPEVYFADSGHLKNVAAAVRRGRLLRCVFCGRNGPTMGCWVERCPKSYHLTCARAAGCYFHHEDYLITCLEHSAPYRKKHRLATAGGQPPPRQAQPWPLPTTEEPLPPPEPLGRSKRVRRAAAVVAEQRISARQDAEREAAGGGDLAADEAEFLRRERRRLQRDLERIAPVRLGGDTSAEAPGGPAPAGWESVAGLRHVVDCLKEMVVFPLLYPDAFARLGGGPPRGVLLHGHPGTGKTLVARALAGACSRGAQQVAFFARKGADCLGKYVGDAERQLRLLFQCAADNAPSIIFFDELDGLAPARSGPAQDQTYASVTATLLALMDATTPRGAVTVIGATNRPDALDPALRRPGRFDREIYFPLPSLSDRAAILRVHTAAWEPPPLPATLAAVARATPGYAGADLAALTAQAALAALKRTLPGGPWAPPPEGSKLPPVHVSARDWARALAAAPSPASRRSCLALLSAPPCSVLSPVTVPLLGPPLAALLHHLHKQTQLPLPERVCAALDSMEGPSPPAVAAEAPPAALWDWASPGERVAVSALVEAGLVSLPGQSPEYGVREDAPPDAEPRKDALGKTRILVSGEGDVGQNMLVGAVVALLEGGGGEVHSASLSSMVMAGHGDAHQGLSRILSDARLHGASVLVMQQVESWAVTRLLAEEGEPASLVASAAWSLFLQQMGDAASAPSLILATTHLPATALPDLVTRFFGGAAPGAARSNTVQADASLGAVQEAPRWRLQRSRGEGSVQCIGVEVGGVDSALRAGMLSWAAHSHATQLAYAYAVRSTANKTERAAKQPALDTFDALGRSPSETVGEQIGGEGSPQAEAQHVSEPEGGVGTINDDCGVQEAAEVGKDAPANRPPRPPKFEGGALLPEEHAVQAALRWCGQQLLRAPHFSEVRRACLEMSREKDARGRAKGDRSASPALVGEAGESTATPDPVPPRLDPPSSSGLVTIARSACSGGFSSAAELVSAVGRIVAAVRRREEAAALRQRRLDGSTADENSYSFRTAAACALQDSVAAWEYAMRGLETAARTARRLAPPEKISASRNGEEETARVGEGGASDRRECKELDKERSGGWNGGECEGEAVHGASERQEEGDLPAAEAAQIEAAHQISEPSEREQGGKEQAGEENALVVERARSADKHESTGIDEEAGNRQEENRAKPGSAGVRWAPQCFAMLVDAVQAEYAKDSTQQREEASIGGDVERLLEGVSATHRRLQACLSRLGKQQGAAALCSKCVQHEQAIGRFVCLQPLTDWIVRGTTA